MCRGQEAESVLAARAARAGGSGRSWTGSAWPWLHASCWQGDPAGAPSTTDPHPLHGKGTQDPIPAAAQSIPITAVPHSNPSPISPIPLVPRGSLDLHLPPPLDPTALLPPTPLSLQAPLSAVPPTPTARPAACLFTDSKYCLANSTLCCWPSLCECIILPVLSPTSAMSVFLLMTAGGSLSTSDIFLEVTQGSSFSVS